MNRPFMQSVVLSLLAVVGTIYSTTANGARGAADVSDEYVIQQLFKIIAKPLPSKMRLAATVEETTEKWTEAQVIDYVDKIEADMKDSNPTLRQLRLNDARKDNSGHKTFYLQEWFDGREYWRGDTSDSTVDPDFIPGKSEYFQSVINYPKVNPVSTLVINPRVASATFNAKTPVKWTRFDLWQAFVIEANAGLPIVTLLADRLSGATLEDRLNTSYEGLKIDPSRVKICLSGTNNNGGLTVSLEPAGLTSQTTWVVNVKLSNLGVTGSYHLDKAHPNRLLRIDLSDGIGGRYLSERSEYDASDFPHRWSVRQEQAGNVVLYKLYRFTLVDLEGADVAKSVFLPNFPTNYTVVRHDSSGPVFLQNPMGSKMVVKDGSLHNPSLAGFFSKLQIIRASIVVVICSSLVVLFRIAFSGKNRQR